VTRTLAVSFLVYCLVPGPAHAAKGFEFANGDRVVLLGNTLIEREQRYGYWETLLTSRYPDRNIQFRNLGWSGDTVFGEAWAEFDTPEVGFRRRKEHVLALKPTVIMLGYGLNESFEGEAGLPRFLKGLDQLLESLAPAKARIILLSPPRHEDLGRPLPDPTEHNKNLRLYTRALRQVAAKRAYAFVDLYDTMTPAAGHKPRVLTDDGIHLTAYGYWKSAFTLEYQLGISPAGWAVEVNAHGRVKSGSPKVSKIETAALSFQVTDQVLPVPPAPGRSPRGAAQTAWPRELRVRGLAKGRYTLRIDGKPIRTESAEQWAIGVELKQGPEFGQAEKLRQAIILKNRLYFHRWRPANDTYLFGFRKQEQGQNAKEIPQFDPLVAKQESFIARLRLPAGHKYELVKKESAE